MTDAIAATYNSQPQTIPERGVLRLDPPVTLPSPSNNNLRAVQLNIDLLSPVNQNGSFEFDRRIKSGPIQKRRKKVKSWNTVHLVLRPNLLSIYRDAEETKLRHKIVLSDVTAIARQNDPKGKAKHVFAVFSPSRNFHFEAKSNEEAQDWIEQIRREARIDHDEEQMSLASPGGAKSMYSGFERHGASGPRTTVTDYSSSDAEMFVPQRTPIRKPQASPIHEARRPSATLDYSGPEYGSFSDLSDAGPAARMSTLSLAQMEPQVKLVNTENTNTEAVYGNSQPLPKGPIQEAESRNRDLQANLVRLQNAERVVCQGWLYLLKTTSGVRQWKKLWMVLRPKALAMYKNEEEYSALKIIPFGTIINAVELDNMSNSKRFCMQLITEERNHRLCAPDVDSWAQWLGSFKSLLAKRRDRLQQQDTGAEKN